MEQLILEETVAGILNNIACRISANRDQVTDRGLLNGKMGVAIFLFHYGRSYNDAASTQLAVDFIDDIRSNMMQVASVDYCDGLIGIDTGLNYLLKNGLIDAGMAGILEIAEQTIYNCIHDLPRGNIHKQLQRLSGLVEYFAQDYRKCSLTTTGSFSKFNRKCVAHIVYLLRLFDVNAMSQLDHRDMLRMMDVLSRIYTTGFREKDIRELLSYALRGLEAVISCNAGFKSFTGGCDPFCIAVSLLQIFERTKKPGFATLAIRLLDEYEGAAKDLYLMNDIPDISLLQHAIACRKLHVILKEDCFNTYAADCLDLYRKRKATNNEAVLYGGQGDFSLQRGYAGEGMALLSLDGCVQVGWHEDVMWTYISN